jgi:hypothetical protein
MLEASDNIAMLLPLAFEPKEMFFCFTLEGELDKVPTLKHLIESWRHCHDIPFNLYMTLARL